MMENIFNQLNTLWEELKKENLVRYLFLLILNGIAVLFQFFYTTIRYAYLNDLIPLWYTKPWSDAQLAPKANIFIIPAVSLAILVFGVFLVVMMRKFLARHIHEVLILVISFANIALTYSLFRIIQISSSPFPSLINPVYFQLFPPFLAGFFLAFLMAPRFISFAKKRGIVTNPDVHNHPAMLLTKPSARGGGLIFTIAFLICTIIFVPMSVPVMGIYLVTGLLALIGFMDDYQNTHHKTGLKFLESPVLRLFILFVAVAIITPFGVEISAVGNPLGGVVQLGGFTLIPILVTVVWIVWILNLLSWSNGIDGQYSGIIGIAAIFIAILALRFTPILPEHVGYAKLAVIAAGCSLGLVYYTWHPSKIMWGFSAISAGLVLASLSILISSKVAVSIMIILIPFLDALVTVIRRILQKKNPLKGDRGHLHHLLLDRGWSVKRIAVFYWVTTAIFGFIGVMASEQYLLQLTLLIGGVVAFFIILLNLQSITRPQTSPQAE
jgi:UDP-GlcNAc:undecaprenyl-phosphate/decaprenyl-phosphate GlcNAc-1-phosphate transferase